MPVRMKGKLYKTVYERLGEAHGATGSPAGIQSVHTEPLTVGAPGGLAAAAIVRATITFADGRVFTGISQITFDATSGAEATNPVEVAETSAVGRALAFAGYYGSDDGIAGAEEVRQAQHRAGTAPPAQPQKPIRTPRDFYAHLAAIAWSNGLAEHVVDWTDDAPDEQIITGGKALKARLLAAGLIDEHGRPVAAGPPR